ncbi:hypothetical protein NIES4071_58580 [Calothrix sp. NIES-4071]|nr:hypothetical protein NIES4071_58580 [Calothrix sp. NIES-4071]BAZ60165.1 hypothetical protein NIES4105_58530 [Calothrix sp. NIES-4105]
MVRVAVINLNGNFENGFVAMLQIGEAGKASSVGCIGRLPPNQEILKHYKKWRSHYSRLGNSMRALRDIEGQTLRFSSIQTCKNAAIQLSSCLNQWLNSKEFLTLKKNLEEIDRSDEIRIIIQNNEVELLRKLPWHLWDIIQSSSAEVALSSPAYELTQRSQRLRAKPRIIAILGNSQGIDVEVDRKLLHILESEKNAEMVYLVEPKFQEIYKSLWDEKGWDILFFAGHGDSHANGKQGKIYINRQDSLSITDLNDALKIAIKRGLRLAIFNSCEGLALIQELENLHIPQVIVMKEPVPDKVAQEFLKYFLEYFTNGESLYISVRKARERLQTIEEFLPSATWLPVICQNPAEIPLTWQELTPPKYEYVSKILEYVLRGILSSEETSQNSSQQQAIKSDSPLPDIIELTSVGDFWASNLRKGQLVMIEGALSQYAPMFIGSPKLKRDVHLGYRRAIPVEDLEEQQNSSNAIDANLAFTAGQMVLRLNPEETEAGWVYMGLYHSIIRNSIPVFVTKDYYTHTVEPLFERDGNRIAYVVEAKVIGKLIPFPGNFIKEFIERNNIKSYIKPELISDNKEILAMFVDGKDTAIKYLKPARYLDGDIWVALKTGVEEYFVSRFVDFSNLEDFRQESQTLAIESKNLLPDGEIVYQFDQVEKIIQGHQTVDSMIKRFTKRQKM